MFQRSPWIRRRELLDFRDTPRAKEILTSLLQRFLAIMSEVFPVNPLAGKEDFLTKLDPERFYVENVRALLNVSHFTAQQICNTAVRQGIFLQQIGVLC